MHALLGPALECPTHHLKKYLHLCLDKLDNRLMRLLQELMSLAITKQNMADPDELERSLISRNEAYAALLARIHDQPC